jgi:hypothetical protein
MVSTARIKPVLRYQIVYEEPVTSVDHPIVGLIKQDFRMKETKAASSFQKMGFTLNCCCTTKEGRRGNETILPKKNALSLN